MSAQVKLVNLNLDFQKLNTNQSKPQRNVRPSAFLNSIDLVPLNYYTPLKIKENKLTKQNYNLNQRLPSLNPIKQTNLPQIIEQTPRIYNNQSYGLELSNVLHPQLLEMNSDEHRRIKTEIDQQNEKINKLLKQNNSQVKMFHILDVINKNNKVEQMTINQFEAMPKRQLKRKQTNGLLLKQDP